MYSAPFQRKSMIRRTDKVNIQEYVNPDIEEIINSKENLDVIMIKIKEFLKTKLINENSPQSLEDMINGINIWQTKSLTQYI